MLSTFIWLIYIAILIHGVNPHGLGAMLLLNLFTLYTQSPTNPIITTTMSTITNNVILILLGLYTQRHQHVLFQMLSYSVRFFVVGLYLLQDTTLTLIALGFILFSPLSPLHIKVHLLILPQACHVLFQNNQSKISSTQDSTTTKSGIFDLSHAILNLDPYTNLYGNLGLWEKINYTHLITLETSHDVHNGTNGNSPPTKNSSTHTNAGKPTTPPLDPKLIMSTNQIDSTTLQVLQTHFDYIEDYLLHLQTNVSPSIPSEIDPSRTYFIASRRFVFLCYFHANILQFPLSFKFQSTTSQSPSKKRTKTKLLDVGFGCGDQLFSLIDFWLDHMNIVTDEEKLHNQISITGVNFSSQQTTIANKRLSQRYPTIPSLTSSPSSSATPQTLKSQHAHKMICDVNLYCGSGTDLYSVLSQPHGINVDVSKNNTLPTQSYSNTFHAITAIDSMYHFPPKAQFLLDAYDLLLPEGYLVCTDLVIRDIECEHCRGYITQYAEFKNLCTQHQQDDTAKLNITTPSTKFQQCFYPYGHLAWILPHITNAFSIPRENLWTKSQYTTQLEQLGYINIQFINLEAYMFDQFITFLNSFISTFPQKLISPSQWIKFLITGYALKNWAPHLFHYSLIIAQKKP